MSREKLDNLNTNVLIGNTAHRGTAWHYRASLQALESNHYAGPIPIADVERRLFYWHAESRAVAVEVPSSIEYMTHVDADGLPVRWQVIPGRQAVARSDTHRVLGLFGDGYQPHQYREWLINNVATILDDGLSISSAGLLRKGAVAWVEVSVPESIRTPEGVEFRPNLLATTSFDGSIATTYKRTITATVCDNTRELALSEHGQQHKVKHTRHSRARIIEAHDALAMVHTLADAFAAEVAQLCAVEVTGSQWARFLDVHVPMADPTGEAISPRSRTLAEHKRDTLQRLYRHDLRVSPWAGTAYGVVQAVNTYEHHEGIVRGAERAERNQLRTITGEFGELDRAAWQQLNQILTSV
jgi:phage/plasmid-like protein (TIGR03299 family)